MCRLWEYICQCLCKKVLYNPVSAVQRAEEIKTRAVEFNISLVLKRWSWKLRTRCSRADDLQLKSRSASRLPGSSQTCIIAAANEILLEDRKVWLTAKKKSTHKHRSCFLQRASIHLNNVPAGHLWATQAKPADVNILNFWLDDEGTGPEKTPVCTVDVFIQIKTTFPINPPTPPASWSLWLHYV